MPAALHIRLLSLLYEALLLAALLLIATALFVALVGDSSAQPLRAVLQIYLLTIAAIYFTWSWSGGRRTLAMRTWRLRLVDGGGKPPSVKRSLVRFVAAAVGLPLGGIALWWALLDRERLLLHDRIAGTRLVRDPPIRARR